MLTIGQLAAYVGVTVRAVRHYHQRGLLAEPARDASGYRRYGAEAVVALIKIKTLADAGVPLARIENLLKAGPEQFSGAIALIDEDLQAKIRALREQRRRIAGLAAGDRLFVPAEVADLLDRLRAIGVGARTVQIERDGWLLLAARYREAAQEEAKKKLAALADPQFQQIYLAFDEAADWDPADPRLEEVAGAIVAFAARHPADPDRVAPAADPVTMALLSSVQTDLPPAWLRLGQLCQDRSRASASAAPPDTARPAKSAVSG